ncbi:MAG: flagellar motor switch protein FliN [Acidobacteriota bacterium]|nr:flagellar motor switch protein FliN [Acidobacteriota bacterium]
MVVIEIDEGLAGALAARAETSAAALGNDSASSLDNEGSNLDLLLDVELEASIRFGQKELLLRDVLNLRPGAVVELARQVNEPAELLVAGRLMARGEVVVVEGNYGLRITEILGPAERIAAIRG